MNKPRKPRADDASNPPATPAEKALILGIAKTMAALTERGDAIAESDEGHQKVTAKETEAIIFEIYRSILPIWNNEILVRRALTAIPLPTNKMNRQKPPYGLVKQALRRHKHKSQYTRYTNALCAAYAGVPHPEKRPMTADEFEAEVQQLGGLNPFHDAYVPRKPRVPRTTKGKDTDGPGEATAALSPAATCMEPNPANSSAALVSRPQSVYGFLEPLPDGAVAQFDRPLCAFLSRKVVAYGQTDERGVAVFTNVTPDDEDEAAFKPVGPRSLAAPKLLVTGAKIDDIALKLLQMSKGRRGETFVVEPSTNGIAVRFGNEECWLDLLVYRARFPGH